MSSSSSPARKAALAATQASADGAPNVAAEGEKLEGSDSTIKPESSLTAAADLAVAKKAQEEATQAALRAEKEAADAAAKEAAAKATREAQELEELEKATRPDALASATGGVRDVLDNPLMRAALDRRNSVAAVREKLPKRGGLLRCDNFENGLSVIGQVEVVEAGAPNGGQVLVWLDALQHHWPIDGNTIDGTSWKHDPKRYPIRGEDEEFDERFRSKVKLHSTEPVVVRTTFKRPRAARQGHSWMRALVPVGALGFTISGDPARVWGPGSENPIGEIDNAAFEPGLFEKI